MIQDSANDSVGLTSIVRPVGTVVGHKQEDGVVQGLLGDGVAVETGEELVPADDQRSVRVVRHVKCLPHTISKDRITLVLFADFCIRFHSRPPQWLKTAHFVLKISSMALTTN